MVHEDILLSGKMSTVECEARYNSHRMHSIDM